MSDRPFMPKATAVWLVENKTILVANSKINEEMIKVLK